MSRQRLIFGVVVALALAGMVALRRTTESPVMTTVAVGPSPSAVVVDARVGHAFVLGGDDTVSMLDTRTGSVLRAVPVGKAAMALAVDERAGRVYVVNSYMHSGGQGTVDVLDSASGRVLHTVPVGPVPYAVAVDEQAGHAFVLNANDGGVSMLDAVSGRVIKTIAVGANGAPMLGPGVLAVDARHGRGFALIQNDPSGPRLRVFDTRRGVSLRTISAGVSPYAVTADVGSGRVYVAGGGAASVVDPATGAAWRASVTFSAPAVVDARRGHVFSANRAGIHMLDVRTGRVVQTVPSDGFAVPTMVDERTGRLVAVDAGPTDGPIDSSCCYMGNGSIDVIDAHSGAVRTVAVGIDPVAAAVDERTGHVFVVNGGGLVREADKWGWLPGWLRNKLPFLPPPGAHSRAVPGSVTVVDLSRL